MVLAVVSLRTVLVYHHFLTLGELDLSNLGERPHSFGGGGPGSWWSRDRVYEHILCCLIVGDGLEETLSVTSNDFRQSWVEDHRLRGVRGGGAGDSVLVVRTIGGCENDVRGHHKVHRHAGRYIPEPSVDLYGH